MKLLDMNFASSKSFFSHDATKLQYPLFDDRTGFNIASDESSLDSSYLDSCLYNKLDIASKTSGSGKLNFNLGIERAIAHLLIPELILKTPEYKDLEGYGGWGFDAEGNFFADYWDNTADEFNKMFLAGNKDFSGGNHQIFKITPDFEISAFLVDDRGVKKKLILDTKANAIIKTEKHSPSGLIFALTALLIENCNKPDVDKSIYSAIEYLSMHFKECVANYNNTLSIDFASPLRALDNDIYTLFKYEGEVKSVFGLPFVPTKIDRNEYPLLRDEDIACTEIVGNSIYLTGAKKVAATGGFVNPDDIPNNKTLLDIVSSGEFTLNPDRVFSKEEENLIPSGLDELVPDRKVVTAAEQVKKSTALKHPQRNIIFTGASGTGKTTSAQMLAKMLGLPYVCLTMHPETLVSDLYVNILPATDADKNDLEELRNQLPTATEIALNPVEAYKKITGKTKEEVTENDCQKAMEDKYAELFNKSNGFIKVESPLVKAFRNGYLVEIQEANTAKSGTLVGLNSCLDALGIIQTPYGETIHRHPDTVVVMTANIGYAGRKQMDESIISRMHIVDEFELPDDETLIKDLITETGYEDENVIQKMIDCSKAFAKTMYDNGYPEDSCGRRELAKWCENTLMFNDPYRAAMTSIINKLSLIASNASGGIDKDIKPLLISDLELKFHKAGSFGTSANVEF